MPSMSVATKAGSLASSPGSKRRSRQLDVGRPARPDGLAPGHGVPGRVAALRPTEVRWPHDDGAPLAQRLRSWAVRRGIRRLSVTVGGRSRVEGHVEVGADEDPLAVVADRGGSGNPRARDGRLLLRERPATLAPAYSTKSTTGSATARLVVVPAEHLDELAPCSSWPTSKMLCSADRPRCRWTRSAHRCTRRIPFSGPDLPPS